MITLHDIDPTEKIKINVFGSNDDQTGVTASDSAGPAIHANSPTQFLVILRKRHHDHH